MLEVPDVQVHVAHDEARADLGPRLLASHRRQQIVHVKAMWPAGVVQRPGPPLARTVGGQLDTVAVGLGKVDRLVRAVV